MNDRNQTFYANLPPEMPLIRYSLLVKFSRWLFSALGWRFVGDVPRISKVVILLAPHTSNWDFFILILAKTALQLRASYMMKREAFFWPFRNWLINIGGIPIDRTKPKMVVSQAAASFNRADGNWLAITPEGTRKKVERYKTGFLRIALEADVPVIVVGINYPEKSIIFSKVVQASTNFEADAEDLRQFCRATFVGKRPQNQ